MAKKKTKKKPLYPKYGYAYFGELIDPQDFETDFLTGDSPTGDESGGSTEGTGRTPKGPSVGMKMAGSAASEIGGMAGQIAHDMISVGIPLLGSMIPDNAKQRRDAPQMAENPNPYGTGSSALYNYGGYMPYPQANQGMAMPISNGQLQVEGGQYSFLSPETINLGGDPHSSGGTKVSYGGNMVEAEAGEPMSIGQDGQAVVWGNMYVPHTNTKFKGAAKKIAKEEKKNTQMLGKATRLLQGSNPNNPNEALSFNTGRALNDASIQNQQKISAYKDSLATLQQAMLDYSEQTGIKPDKLGKSMKKGGSISMPKYKKGGCMECGGSIAKGGKEIPPLYVPDADNERYKMYQDSTNLHKAYLYQKAHNIGKQRRKENMQYIKEVVENPITPPEIREMYKKTLNMPDPTGKVEKSDRNQFRYTTPAKMKKHDATFDPLGDGERNIDKYYKTLPFNYPVHYGQHSSPDLIHSRIGSPYTYFDGSAWSPIYRAPVQQVIVGTDPNAVPPPAPIAAPTQQRVPINNAPPPAPQRQSGIPIYPKGQSGTVPLLGFLQEDGTFVSSNEQGIEQWTGDSNVMRDILGQEYIPAKKKYGGSFQDGGFVPIAGQEYGIAAYPMFPPSQDTEQARNGFKLNPEHEGWCTPMTKSTCTGKRRQFAINAKNHFQKQAQSGTQIPDWRTPIDTREYIQSSADNTLVAPTPRTAPAQTVSPRTEKLVEGMRAGQKAEERAMKQRVATRKAAVEMRDDPNRQPSLLDPKLMSLALQQRGRVFPDEEHWFDEYVNPLHQFYNMGSGLAAGFDPTNNDPWKLAKGIGTPLVAGMLSNLGGGKAMGGFDEWLFSQPKPTPQQTATYLKSRADEAARLGIRSEEELLATDLGTGIRSASAPPPKRTHSLGSEAFDEAGNLDRKDFTNMFVTPEGEAFTNVNRGLQYRAFDPKGFDIRGPLDPDDFTLFERLGRSSSNNTRWTGGRDEVLAHKIFPEEWEAFKRTADKTALREGYAVDEFDKLMRQTRGTEYIKGLNKILPGGTTQHQFPLNLNKYGGQIYQYGGQIGNVGDEIELSQEELDYYRSLGYEFE